MRGVIIFIAAFLVFVVITLGYQDLPPARLIYDAIVEVETEYKILGISATRLIIATFNGVIYGIIIWLIYSLAEKMGIISKGKK